jgi:hypothetical protein
MGKLRNAKHELFCQKLACGVGASEAYMSVNPEARGAAARAASSRLRAQSNIKERIEEIRADMREADRLEKVDPAIDPIVMDRVETIVKAATEEASKMATKRIEECLSEFLDWAERRRYLARIVRTPICEVSPKSDLCQEYKEIPTEYGTAIQVKMPNKLQAVIEDAKLAGEYGNPDGGGDQNNDSKQPKGIIVVMPSAIAQPRITKQLPPTLDV